MPDIGGIHLSLRKIADPTQLKMATSGVLITVKGISKRLSPCFSLGYRVTFTKPPKLFFPLPRISLLQETQPMGI